MDYFSCLEITTSHIHHPFSDKKSKTELSSHAKTFTLLAGLATAAAVAYGRKDRFIVRLASSCTSGGAVFYLTAFCLKKKAISLSREEPNASLAQAVELFQNWLKEQKSFDIDEKALQAFLTLPVQQALLENIEKIKENFQGSPEKFNAFFEECAQMCLEFKNTPTDNTSYTLEVDSLTIPISSNAIIDQAFTWGFVATGYLCKYIRKGNKRVQNDDFQKTLKEISISTDSSNFCLYGTRGWTYVHS